MPPGTDILVSCIPKNPAYGGSPAACHKVRGVSLSYLDTRHPETDICQKTHSMWFNVGFQPYADHDTYRASIMVGLCTGKVEEEPEFQGKEPPQACSVYR